MRQSSKPSKVKLKRVYEPASRTDGTRILVDRLWPRRLSKEEAAIDHWCKELAPSTALRQWFGHEPDRWEEFRKRYKAELAQQPESLTDLRAFARKGPITLLFAAHDELRNNAVVVHELLRAKSRAAKVPVKTTGKTRRKT
jgi:uncharacterized protein YeaO (DUF488 family)